jgi:hypothetical protein
MTAPIGAMASFFKLATQPSASANVCLATSRGVRWP